MPLVGYNYGAGDKEELHSLLIRSLRLLFGLGLILAVTAQLIAGPAARLFVGYYAELTALTIRASRIYMPSVVLSGLTLFVSSWFTGLNNGPVSAVASFSRSLVFELGAVFALPAFIGMEGIWLSVDIAEICAFLLGAFLLLRYRSRYGY
jgi:Na+-driven multidrug efflux pump